MSLQPQQQLATLCPPAGVFRRPSSNSSSGACEKSRGNTDPQDTDSSTAAPDHHHDPTREGNQPKSHEQLQAEQHVSSSHMPSFAGPSTSMYSEPAAQPDAVVLQVQDATAQDATAQDAAAQGPSCWICLCGPEEGKLTQPCACVQLHSHPKCLARWQLRQLGKEDELICRFCKAQLPPWVDVLGDEGAKAMALHAERLQRRRNQRLCWLAFGIFAMLLVLGAGLILFSVRFKKI